MTAHPAPMGYEDGARVVYRHRGTTLVGTFRKAQRRAAVIEDKDGRRLTVPWNAVDGPATGKGIPHHGG